MKREGERDFLGWFIFGALFLLIGAMTLLLSMLEVENVSLACLRQLAPKVWLVVVLFAFIGLACIATGIYSAIKAMWR